MTIRTTVFCALVFAMSAIATIAHAQPYPYKPIRIIVPYASGAGPDFTGREIGKSLTEALGQPVVTDNRPGGGATLGHAIGAKAPPDGYTLILLTTMPHVKAGRVKLLGVGHTQCLRWMPDLPTIAETIAGYYNTGWWGLVAPAGLPKPIVDRLNPIMNKWLITPPIFAPIK